MALQVIGARLFHKKGNDHYPPVAVGLICPICGFPAGAILRSTVQSGDASSYQGRLKQVNESPQPVTDYQFELVSLIPAPTKHEAPPSSPESVSRTFVQAEACRARKELDAAGSMYRKSVDLATKTIDPQLAGIKNLATRINKLADAGLISPKLAEWASAAKELGNDATHEDDEPDPEDIVDLAEITRLLLMYLFELPGRLDSVRSRKKPAP